MKTLADRIRERRKELKFSQAKLAELVGITQGSLSHLESGRNETSKELPQIAQKLGVTVEWLLTGKETSDTISRNNQNSTLSLQSSLANNVVPVSTQLVPVLSWVQAGTFTTMHDINTQDITKWLPRLSSDDPNECFYLEVRGISNYPEYQEGDFILIDPTYNISDLVSGDLVVVRTNTESTFKKLIIEPSGHKYLQALNPAWQPNIIEFEAETILVGIVVDAFRPLGGSKPHRRRL